MSLNICSYSPIKNHDLAPINERFKLAYKYICYLLANQGSGGGGGGVFDATVEFSVNANPNTGGTTFFPDTPALTTVLYVSTIDNSQWVYRSGAYVTYTSPFWNVTGNPSVTINSFIGSTNNQPLKFRTNNIQRGLFDISGNFGINNLTPTERLDVTGNIRFSGALMPNNQSGTSGTFLMSQGSGSPIWSNSPITTLANIGSSPNANGASIIGGQLTLQPANTSFGGIVSTGSQSFSGVKTYLNNVYIGNTTSVTIPGLNTLSNLAEYTGHLIENTNIGGAPSLIFLNNLGYNRRSGIFKTNSTSASSGGGLYGTGANSLNIINVGADPIAFLTNNVYRAQIKATGEFVINNLSGSGTRMVVAASDGQLSTQAIPSVNPNSLSTLTPATGINAIDNNNFSQIWQWNGLSNSLGALQLSSTSTASIGNNVLLRASMSGNNSNAGVTTNCVNIQNQHSGSLSTNVALYVAATSGTNNYSIISGSGNVGISNSTPAELLSIGSTTIRGVIGLYGNISGKTILQPSSNAGNWTLTLPSNSGSSGEVLQTDGLGNTSWVAQTGGGFSTNFADEEIPSGIINGTNNIFTLTNPPITGSVKFYVRGSRLKRDVDYTISGSIITITASSWIPNTGDPIIADYRY